jgi:hypothetical protein
MKEKLWKVRPPLKIKHIPTFVAGSSKRGVTLMKKRFTLIGYAVLIMLTATFLACASAPRMETPGEADKISRTSPEALRSLKDGGADPIAVDTLPSGWYKKGNSKEAIQSSWRDPLGEPVDLFFPTTSIFFFR